MSVSTRTIRWQSSWIIQQCPPLVNVGCGVHLTIKELADLIKDIVGFNGQLTFATSKPDGAMRKLMDVSKLKQLGWQATISMRDGIQAAKISFLKSVGL